MPRGYSRERTSIHDPHYHFVWCPKYRKSVLTDEVTNRLEHLIEGKADELDLDILRLAIQPDHVHLFIRGDPKLAPNEIIQRVEGYTSRNLREEFDFGLSSLWTRSYLVSSADEVKDLADRTKEAIADVERRLERLRERRGEIVEEVDRMHPVASTRT
jgi:putative transposase